MTEEFASDEAFGSLGAVEELCDYDVADRSVADGPDAVDEEEITASKQSSRPKPATKKKRQQKAKQSSAELHRSVPGSTALEATVDSLASSDGGGDYSAWANMPVPDSVLQALRELGFSEPTPIQAASIPTAIASRRDIIGAAETGSGKTLAFAIPILHHLIADRAVDAANDNRHLGALILVPTRELAKQVTAHFRTIAKHSAITSCLIIGGICPAKQDRFLRKKPDVVIGTPGRIWEKYEGGDVHLQQGLHKLRYLVIDEADRMAEKGHFDELLEILKVLNRAPPTGGSDDGNHTINQRQTYIFSATLLSVQPVPKRLQSRGGKKIQPQSANDKLETLMQFVGIGKRPKVVDLSTRALTATNLQEFRVECAIDEKDAVLYYILQHEAVDRTIVFCNSIDCVRRLKAIVGALFIDSPRHVLVLHSKMQQRQRLKYMDKFMQSNTDLLLTTDVAARGLDIPNVEHVIHFQVPRTFEAYVHRSGRTARAHKSGKTILLVEPSEELRYQQVMRNLGRGEQAKQLLPTLLPLDLSRLKVCKERVGLAQQVDRIEHRHRRDTSRQKWFERAARETGIDWEDDAKDTDGDAAHAERERRKQLKRLRGGLSSTSAAPVSKKRRGAVPKEIRLSTSKGPLIVQMH